MKKTMAKYTNLLNEIRKKNNISFDELGDKLGKHQQTIRDKFKSETVSETIDLLHELGLTILDKEGKTIGEESELIKLTDIYLSKKEIDNLKNLLKNG